MIGLSMTGRSYSEITRREATIDRLIHLCGITAACIGSIVLLALIPKSRQASLFMPVLAYILGLLAMLVCSALHNVLASNKPSSLRRRLDHAAIFLLIAGTYSPFIGGETKDHGLSLLYAAVWIAAVAGIAAKLFLPNGLEKRLSVALYLGLGWSAFLYIGPVSTILPPQVLWLIALGGALYSVGVIFHLCERLPYQNAIWHGFVVAGAAVHFLAVSGFVTR